MKLTVRETELLIEKKREDENRRLQERAKKHLFYFAEIMEENDPIGKFFRRDYWQVIIISMLFDLAEEGLFRYCTISQPPRSGKSYVTTRAMQRQIACYPQTNNMRNSYSASLAVDVLSVAVRDFIKNNETFHKVFPDIKINKSSGSKDRWKIEGYENLAYIASGVGGASSGMGSNGLLILDDEYQGIATALSPAIREATEQFLSSVHLARREKNFKGMLPREFYVCTRWTHQDTIGKLKKFEKGFELDILKYKKVCEEKKVTDKRFEEIYKILKADITEQMEGDDEKIVHLTIPALIEYEGKLQSFCEPLCTTKEWLRTKTRLERRGESYIWNAVYMQSPTAKASLLFSNLKTFSKMDLPFLEKQPKIAYIDPAFGGGDYCAMAIAAIVDKKYYVLDVVYDMNRPEKTKPKILSKLREWGVRTVTGEGNNQGEEYLKSIRDDFYDKSYGSFRIIKNSKSKIERILLRAGKINEMCYFREEADRDREYSSFFNELKEADIYLQIDHDDATDTMAGLVEINPNATGSGAFNQW